MSSGAIDLCFPSFNLFKKRSEINCLLICTSVPSLSIKQKQKKPKVFAALADDDFMHLRTTFLIQLLISDGEKEGKRWDCCKTNARLVFLK